MAYVIGSEKGKKKAEEMQVGEKYTATDGSVWTKEADGSVSVNQRGKTYNNAYTPYTGSSNSVITNNTDQLGIKEQMNANSIAWWTADENERRRLEAENQDSVQGSAVQLVMTQPQGFGVVRQKVQQFLQRIFLIGNMRKDQRRITALSPLTLMPLREQLLNYGEFSYDAESDPLYQQYKQMYQREGERAMKETMAEAAASAGGMNTYAMTAAQQANNYYDSKVNDMIPQLYQLAYSMYLDDRNSLMQNLELLQGMDNTEYNRYRDTVGDWEKERNFNYGVYLDAINQGNWQSEFDYNAMVDNRNFNYDSDWADKKWNYETNTYNREMADKKVDVFISRGEMPSDELIAQSSWDKADVERLVGAEKASQVKKNTNLIDLDLDDDNPIEDNTGVRYNGDAGVIGLGIGPISDETLLNLVERGVVILNADGTVRWAEGYNPRNYKQALSGLESFSLF